MASRLVSFAVFCFVLLAIFAPLGHAQRVIYGGESRQLNAHETAIRDLVIKHANAWATPCKESLRQVMHRDVVFAYPSRSLRYQGVMDDFDAFVESSTNTTITIPRDGIIMDWRVGIVYVSWKFANDVPSIGKRRTVNDICIGRVKDGQFIEWLEFLDGRVKFGQDAGVLSHDDGPDGIQKPWPAFVPGKEQCRASVKFSCPLPSYTDGKIHWDLIPATGQVPPAYFDSVGVYDPEKRVYYMSGGLTNTTYALGARPTNATYVLSVDSLEWTRLSALNGPDARCDQVLAMGSSSNLVHVIGGRGAFRTTDATGKFIDTMKHSEYVYNAATGSWSEVPLRHQEADLVGRAAAKPFQRVDPATGEVQNGIFGGLGNTLPRWFALERGTFNDIILHSASGGWEVVKPVAGSPVPLGRAWANTAYVPEIDTLLVHAGFGNESQATSTSPDPSLPLDWVDSNVYDDLWAFSFATRTWTRLNVTGPKPRERSGGIGTWDPVHQAMIIFGGYNFYGQGTTDFWALHVNTTDLHASRWEDLSPRVQGSVPVGRIGAAHFDRVTPAGFEVWIIGGADRDARYNVAPSADIYRVILPTVLAPVA